MKYYVDKQDNLFGFEDDGSQNHLITDDMTQITQDELDERTKPLPTEPKYHTMKHDIWQRATPDECEILDHALSQATAKERRLFDDSTRIEHNDEYFPMLQAQITELLGEARALELLAPSNA